jgi:hypothetical protein
LSLADAKLAEHRIENLRGIHAEIQSHYAVSRKACRILSGDGNQADLFVTLGFGCLSQDSNAFRSEGVRAGVAGFC